MRLYSFVNGLYLNQLQYGLQTAHCISRLSLQDSEMYKEWALNHETIIILDATNSRGVRNAYNLISIIIGQYNLNIPFTIFNEDIDSLDGATTCAACVLPETVYAYDCIKTRDEMRFITNLIIDSYTSNDSSFFNQYSPEYLLFCVIKSYNLASH